QWTIDIVNAAIIGGLATVFGPLLGALIIVEVGVQLSGYPELHIALTGALLILVIRFAPRGVWGTVAAAAAKRLGSGAIGRAATSDAVYRQRTTVSPAEGPLLEVVGLGKSFG